MGGTDEASNIIEVSVEEHAELHLDLYLKHGYYEDWLASQCLSGQIVGEDIQKHWDELRRTNHRKVMVGRKMSQETKDKIRNALMGKKKSPEHAQKCRENARKVKGHKQTAEHKANTSKAAKNRSRDGKGRFIPLHKKS